jgi:hypothetical protein
MFLKGKNSLVVTSHLGQQHTGYISISERGQLLAYHMEHLKEHFKNLMGTHWEQVGGKTTKNPRVGPLPNMLHSYSPNEEKKKKKKSLGLMHACMASLAEQNFLFLHLFVCGHLQWGLMAWTYIYCYALYPFPLVPIRSQDGTPRPPKLVR